jgi:uncharacterized membrane protein
MSPQDWCALGVFVAAWLGYAFAFSRLFPKRGINFDMLRIRGAWMAQMTRRENRFMDANLMGHVLNTASFFASTNLLIIAAVIGALFGGEATWRAISGFTILARTGQTVFDLKLALIIVTLARSMLDFIWGIRQINYFLAIIGAVPDGSDQVKTTYGEAAAALLDPAMSAVNNGVRGYYFALAAAAWLFGPYAAIAATIGAIVLLIQRQLNSRASRAVARVRSLLDGP